MGPFGVITNVKNTHHHHHHRHHHGHPTGRPEGGWEVGPPKQTTALRHRTLTGRETNRAKETAKSWHRKDIKDLPSLLSQILLSLDKNPIPREPPELHPAEEPALHTSVSTRRAAPYPRSGLKGSGTSIGVSNASRGTRGHLIAVLGETVMKIFYCSLTASS